MVNSGASPSTCTVGFHCVGVVGSLIVLVFVTSLLYDFGKTSEKKK